MAADERADEPRLVETERGVRLSSSMLWRLQREFFEQSGVTAWQHSVIPSYVTTNPYIASTYARLILGYLRDCHAAGILEPGAPFYVVEIGAGSGRFAYHVLKALDRLLERFEIRDLRVTYVITDFSDTTLDFHRSHAWLRPFVERRRLDFARFNPIENQEISLDSGSTLSADTTRNPCVFLANYFFDGIPQDAYFLENGSLYEALVTLRSPTVPESEEPSLREGIEISYEHRQVERVHYDDPLEEVVLERYRGVLSNTYLSFPTAGFACLRNLHQLSGGRMLLISADKGYHRLEEMKALEPPSIVLHGSFSMMVNYHALAQYSRGLGGEVFQTTHHHSSIDVVAYAFGLGPNGCVRTAQSFDELVESGGPDDLLAVNAAARHEPSALTVSQALALLRLSGWDASTFLACHPTLRAKAREAPPTWRREVRTACMRVWDTYFPIGEREDLAFAIGALLYQLGFEREALVFLEQSLRLHGPDTGTLYNMALCHHYLGEPAEALRYVDASLELASEYERALALRAEILAANPGLA